jgi:hypothetical protein
VADQLALDLTTAPVRRSARLSRCGRYRYLLERRWADGPALAWVMLNPSTADAEVDDPTIRRVVRFTSAAGYSAVVVANLYALRATDGRQLTGHPDPVGPGNARVLDHLARRGGLIVAAWGAAASRDRVAAVLTGPLAGAHLRCLGTTSDRQPRHPLYLPSAQPLQPYPTPDPRRTARA